jgi:hypothetical protein
MAQFRFAMAVVLAALLVPPASAQGADSIYWTDYTSGQIRVGNLDGTGSPRTLFGEETQPMGIAIDPAAGKIYWSAAVPNCTGLCGLIRVGNLDGSGSAQTLFGGAAAPVDDGEGIAVDPAAGKIYWVGEGIEVGNIDGTGTPQTLYATTTVPPDDIEGPVALAIDPFGGRLFWTAAASGGNIRAASLFGDPATNHIWFPNESSPYGIALDPLSQKLYWSRSTASGAIRIGNADGTETAKDLYAPESNPLGIALDPPAGKVYVASGTEAILVGSLDGGGSLQTLFPDGGSPQYPAVLRAPVATRPPSISGGDRAGEQLSCDRGGWAPDMPEAVLFRAPRDFAFHWLRDGDPLAGADSSAFTPDAGGSYSCQVTASNQAGGTSQTSAPRTIAPPTFGSSTDVTLGPGSVRIRSLRRLNFLISNTNGFAVTGSLTGTASGAHPPAHPREIALGPAGVSVGAGASEPVSLQMPKPLRHLLERKRHVTVHLTLQVTDPAGVSRTVTATESVRLARTKRSRR